VQRERNYRVELATDGMAPHTAVWRPAILDPAKRSLYVVGRQLQPALIEHVMQRR